MLIFDILHVKILHCVLKRGKARKEKNTNKRELKKKSKQKKNEKTQKTACSILLCCCSLEIHAIFLPSSSKIQKK